MKIAILPGDGIGTEIVAAGRAGAAARSTCASRPSTRLVGGAAYEAHGHPLPEATLRARQGGRRGAVRRRRRLEVRQARARAAPRAGDPRPAQVRWACSPTSGRRSAIRQLTHASSLKPELVGGPRHPDHPRAHRRHLLRPAARPAQRARRRLHRRRRGLRHDALHAARRSSASPTSPSRRRASAASALTSVDKANVLETFQFWKDVVTEVHAAVSRRDARPHVRRQRGDAAGAGAEEVRRDRHRQHVRRHPLGRGGDAHRLDRHAALGLARCRTARACTSRATAARPTSPARTWPIRWLQSCPPP